MPVSQPARYRSDQCASHTKQAKHPSHAASVVARQVSQMESQHCPEHTERAKPTGADDGVTAQYWLTARDIPN
jgi:hypothetical protein